MPDEKYLVAAKEILPGLTVPRLAVLLQRIDEISGQRDQENRKDTLVISALLELLGGMAFLPVHALENAPGYECIPGEHAGDLLLRSR